MADFYYETYISVRGPWLLDMSQLSDLDSAILQQWERLEAYREQIIDQEVQSKLPDAIESAYPKPEKRKEKDAVRDELRKRVATTYTNSKNELTVTLHLRGGKKLVASTIKEAIEHAGVADTEVMELTVEIEVVEVRAKLIIDMKDNSVACRVLPESLTESRELFAVFRDWIEKHRPKRWLCIWRACRFASFPGLVLLFWVIGSIFILQRNEPPSSYATNGVNLLKQGITVTNELKAVETILALQLAYNPNHAPPEIPRWWAPTTCLLSIASVLFIIAPRSHIGIGKAESKVKYWRGWIRICTVLIPGLVFSSFIWPTIVDFIRLLFK